MKNWSPFDILKVMFKPTDEFDSIPKKDLRGSFFIIHRTLSIKFPEQIENLNTLNLDPVSILKLWRETLKNVGGTPSWVWTKTKKQPKTKVKEKDEELLNSLLDKFNIAHKDWKLAEKLEPKKIAAFWKKWESINQMTKK